MGTQGTFTLAATAAGVLAAVVASFALTNAATPREAAPGPAPAPTRAIALSGTRFVLFDPAEGTVLDTHEYDPYGRRPSAVAAVGDSRTFYWATVGPRDGDNCDGLIERVTVDGGTFATTVVARAYGLVQALAVRPDGAALAYTVADHDGGPCAGHKKGLRVRDLATGDERTWPTRWPFEMASLTWSPDGRHLALGGGYETFDTQGTATRVTRDKARRDSIGGHDCLYTDEVYVAGGEVAGAARCPRYDDGDGVYVTRPGSDEPPRLLFASPRPGAWLSRLVFDRSGDHAFVRGADGREVYRWERGGQPQRVELPFRVRELAW